MKRYKPTLGEVQARVAQSIAHAKRNKQAALLAWQSKPNRERDQRIVIDCVIGMTRRQLAERYAISQLEVADIVCAAGFKQTPWHWRYGPQDKDAA